MPDGPDKGYEIELTMPPNGWMVECQFSMDEDTVVASFYAVDEDVNIGGNSIALWNLLDSDGRYRNAAEIAFLLKTFDSGFPFTITPKLSTTPRGGVMDAFSDGSIAQRTLTETWSIQEDENLASSRLGLSAGGKSLIQIDSHGEKLHIILCSKIT